MDLWDAWQRVEFIRNLSARARVRAGHDLAEAERMLVLAMLWVLPDSTAEDLAELRYLSGPRIKALLEAVIKDSYVGSALMGHVRGVELRHFLLPKGVMRAAQYWGVPEEWQVQDDTLKLLHDCLPIVEVVNDVIPRLFRTQAVRTPTVVAVGPKDEPHFMTVDHNTRLCRLIWVRTDRRLVHALVQYRNDDGSRVWIAVVWIGYVCSADQRVERLSDFYNGFRTEPSVWYGEPAAPAGAVYLVPDRLSGVHVTMTVAKNIPKAVVTARGEVIEQLTPVSPVGYLYPFVEEPNVRPVGISFLDWVKEPDRGATYGKERYAAFREVGASAGISPTRLGEVVGVPRSESRTVVNRFKAAGLVRECKGIKATVVSPALGNVNRPAELDLAEKRVRLPLRLLTEPGSMTKTEFEVEVDADRDRVVEKGNEGTARMKVLVKKISRNERNKRHKVEVIADLVVRARSTATHVSVDVDVSGWPITIKIPFALGDQYRDTRLYLTPAGEVLFSRMDRESLPTYRDRFGEYWTARGRIKKASHDSKAHRLMGQLLKEGGNRRLTAAGQRWFAYSGLRMVINFPGKTQVAPDVWLIMPIGNGWGLLVAGEYEQSALTDNRVKKKLGPYDVARQLDAAVPMLMACKRRAVQDFRVRGHRLAMLVASFREALAGRWMLPNQNPNAAPQIVDAQRLARRKWRDELLQRLDLTL